MARVGWAGRACSGAAHSVGAVATGRARRSARAAREPRGTLEARRLARRRLQRARRTERAGAVAEASVGACAAGRGGGLWREARGAGGADRARRAAVRRRVEGEGAGCAGGKRNGGLLGRARGATVGTFGPAQVRCTPQSLLLMATSLNELTRSTPATSHKSPSTLLTRAHGRLPKRVRPGEARDGEREGVRAGVARGTGRANLRPSRRGRDVVPDVAGRLHATLAEGPGGTGRTRRGAGGGEEAARAWQRRDRDACGGSGAVVV